MQPARFGRLASAIVGFVVVSQACGSNHRASTPSPSPSPSPSSCTTIDMLPCFLVKTDPTVPGAALTLKDPSGVTTDSNWMAGQTPTANNDCFQSDPNGPFLYLAQAGAYQLTIDANGYQPSTLAFTLQVGVCGNGACASPCLQPSPAPLQVTLTPDPT